MENLSDEELIKKLWRYKFSVKTTMTKISEEIGWTRFYLSKTINDKKQLTFMARERLLWFLAKKEQENSTTY